MKATIVRIHARHYTIVDREQTPVKRLWETIVGFGDLSPQRDPLEECKQWLTFNGYFPTTNAMEWVKGKPVVVRWTAAYETTIIVPEDAPLDGPLVKDEAANIAIDVPGSTYQSDTWEVESIRPATPE